MNIPNLNNNNKPYGIDVCIYHALLLMIQQCYSARMAFIKSSSALSNSISRGDGAGSVAGPPPFLRVVAVAAPVVAAATGAAVVVAATAVAADDAAILPAPLRGDGGAPRMVYHKQRKIKEGMSVASETIGNEEW
jgi:hypothetical protein